MQKLKVFVLKKMMKEKVTNAELDFVLYIARIQSPKGQAAGVYYKDVCKSINISYQAFYDVMNSLSGKNIIQVVKNHMCDWDVTILDNDFEEIEAQEYVKADPYINMGQAIFSNPDFINMKSNEKLLAMNVIRIAGANQSVLKKGKGKYCIGTDKFFDKYKERLGVTKRILRGYIASLRRFFSIGIKEKKYYFTPLQEGVELTVGIKSEVDTYRENITRMALRRERITYDDQDFADTVNLLAQYSNQMKNHLIECFLSAVHKMIHNQKIHTTNKYKWNRELQPKYVHMLMREEFQRLLDKGVVLG